MKNRLAGARKALKEAWRKKSAVIVAGVVVVTLVVLSVWLARRDDHVAAPRPDTTFVPPAPTPTERAEHLRLQALDACHRELWDECRTKLDDAASLDPAGESRPDVKSAREALATHGK